MNLKFLLWFLLSLSQIEARRTKRFLIGKDGCPTLVECLSAGNIIFPYRLNFNPITAYDRIRSHMNGQNGWTRSEVRTFDRQRNNVFRLKKRQELRRKLHRKKIKLLQNRHSHILRQVQMFQEANTTQY